MALGWGGSVPCAQNIDTHQIVLSCPFTGNATHTWETLKVRRVQLCWWISAMFSHNLSRKQPSLVRDYSNMHTHSDDQGNCISLSGYITLPPQPFVQTLLCTMTTRHHSDRHELWSHVTIIEDPHSKHTLYWTRRLTGRSWVSFNVPTQDQQP